MMALTKGSLTSESMKECNLRGAAAIKVKPICKVCRTEYDGVIGSGKLCAGDGADSIKAEYGVCEWCENRSERSERRWGVENREYVRLLRLSLGLSTLVD